jgi:hypothetical protein
VLRAWKPTPVSSADYVFPGEDGDRLTGVKSAWLELLKDAKITRFRFHDPTRQGSPEIKLADTTLRGLAR